MTGAPKRRELRWGRVALLFAATVGAWWGASLAMQEIWRRETIVLPWPLALAVAIVGMLVSFLLAALTIGTIVADGMRMTCPRCGGGLAWFGWRWDLFVGTRHWTACFRCNALMRMRRTDSGWVEIGKDD